ncbi:NACHT domain-containing protein [Bacillus tropicus]|uniref:alpha/beta hydrolase n=1 Tax=Bacillus tropicus TaxID=2026188 RepID=UPI0023B11AF4|nr:NACHT domain-containing protein [Bacillus tropicus]MDE7552309.1 NACHT domain-containing protein [Bacillus tropicus]MDE7573784.1 NACHT domain-containing protein [Bacillus tropicus]
MGEKGLLKVRQSGNKAAVIFVHGLQGDPYKTWTKKKCNSMPDMLAEDEQYNKFDIFTFGYSTGFIFKRHEFKDIADLLYTEIEAKLSDYRDLSFITHSMGGIIVQSMLKEQVERKNKKFIEKANGIVYLAVPFLGSNVASKVSFVPYLLLPPILGERFVSIQVQALKVFSKPLADLSVKWNQYRDEELLEIKELNLYGQSDKAVAVHSARAPHIKNSKAVNEGHISICKVDKESTVYQLIAQFHKELRESSKKKIRTYEPEMKKYLEWIKLRTEKFLVPGANVPLPIDNAWASLYIMDESSEEASESLEKEIAKYHEWERLSNRREVKKNAQEIIELGKRIVLMGGPGSGKSTLAKRTANRLAIRGEKVVYIRLPNVAKEMEQGKSFEDALWSNALDGYQGDKTLLKSEMKDISIIIADGLDECEPFRKRVSQSLHDWLIGRENTRMILTTRPVGYEPAQFNSFSHIEILPLTEKEIEMYSLKLLKSLNEDEEKALELHNSFQKQLKTNKMVNIASRSPLLLNFLIQLLVSGHTFGSYRADLYCKILEEWMKQSDRGKEKKLDEQIALRSIEWIGWILQNALEGIGGRSEQDVLRKLSSFIEDELDYKHLQAKQLANICLQFWVDIGILEHIKVGYEGGYTFIHLTLGEYAAGKHINSLKEEEQRKIFLEKMHVPVWRETLLLASGIGCAPFFVDIILDKIAGKIDLYSDIAFAAAMLAEGPPIQELNKKVTEAALNPLTSPYSSLCYEVCNSLEGIALQEPNWLFEFVKPLLQHEYSWTKLVAYKFALLTKQINVDLTTIQTLISIKPQENINLQNFKISSGWMIWNESIELSMKQAIDNTNLSEEELCEILKEVSKSGTNARVHLNILKCLQEIGRTDLLNIFDEKLKDKLNNLNFNLDFNKIESKTVEGEKALFNAVLRQIPIKYEKDLNKEVPLVETSKLIEALGYGEKPIGDLHTLVNSADNVVIDEIIKGVLLVYEFDQDNLYKEIYWLLNNSDDHHLLFLKLPDVLTPEPNWKQANNLLERDVIIRSLNHSSETVASNGTLLLINCFEHNTIIEPFIKAFREAEGESLFYFGVAAEYILEERAFDIILEHLEKKLTIGSFYLFENLKKIPRAKNNIRVNNILVKGINSDNSIIAKEAAKTMLELGGSFDGKELLKLVRHWDKVGVLCDRDGIQVVGGFCPMCNVVPRSPLPDLIKILTTSEFFELEDRIYFSNHQRSDVGEIGRGTLTYYLANHTDEIIKLIQAIKIEEANIKLLDAIFNLDVSILTPFSEELFSLYESKEDRVRKRLLEELTRGNWFNIDNSIPLVLKGLEDKSNIVRDQAIKTYRSLGLSEEI